MVADLLDSLARQDAVDFAWEVVVVDNASTDGTGQMVKEKGQAFPVPVRCVSEKQLGLHHGRHRGAHEARGEILGFLDDDMILVPSWIKGSELVYQGRSDAVVGRILPRWEAPPPRWLSRFTTNGVCPYLGLLDLGLERKPVDPLMVFGGNCFMRAELLFSLGGFHPDSVPSNDRAYRGDGETGLMLKFKARGLTATYDPAATAYHRIGADRLTADYLCKRAFNEGVSSSFTAARSASGGTVHSEPVPPPSTGLRVLRALRRAARNPVAAVGRLREILVSAVTPGADIQRRVRAAFDEGRAFHLHALAEDPALRDYVLREHYLPDNMRPRTSA